MSKSGLNGLSDSTSTVPSGEIFCYFFCSCLNVTFYKIGFFSFIHFFLVIPFPGQTILYSLLVFVLVGIIVIVSSILYLKSKSLKKRRKYSKPDESLGHENQRSESDGGGGGYNKNVTGIRNSSPFVKLSSFPTSITPVQVYVNSLNLFSFYLQSYLICSSKKNIGTVILLQLLLHPLLHL